MKGTYSIIRLAENREAAKLQLNGRVLDVGGDKRSRYREEIKGDFQYHVINFSTEYLPDEIVDIEKTFPYEDGTFDHCVCFNVLEHVFEAEFAFSEMVRVTKKEGKVVTATPFMFYIHGSPDDYMRYTESYFRRLAKKYECDIESLVPMGGGFFSVGCNFICGWIPTYPLKKAVIAMVMFLDKFFSKISRRYRALTGKLPIGYFVVFVKK